MPSSFSPQRIADAWSQLSRGTRLAAVLGLIAALVWAAWQWRAATQVTYVPLLEGCEISNADAQRMRVAFAKANLSEGQFSARGVHVPQHRWAAYLQALVDQDAIPEKLKPHLLQPPNVNLFATRRQQDQLDLYQRKQNLRELIVRLPFVESAIVDLDMLDSAAAYQPRQYSCVISVQPRAGQILHDEEVESIRRIVLGAVAGASADRIYVTDLNCGITHDPNWNAGDAVQAEPVRWRQLQATQDLKERIQSHLADLGPLEVHVRFVASPRRPPSQTGSIPNSQAATAPLQGISPEQSAGSALPVAGSNSQASVRQSQHGQGQRLAVAPGSTGTSHQVDRFAIAVAVPEASLQSYWHTATHASQGSSVAWTDDQTRLAFDRLRIDVFQRIRSILPSDEPGEEPSIEISLIHDPALRNAASRRWQHWLDAAGIKPGGGIAVLASCLAILALVSFVATRRPRRATLASTIADPTRTATNPRLAELKQQIDQLIHNDPDTAARVIQQWLRRTN